MPEPAPLVVIASTALPGGDQLPVSFSHPSYVASRHCCFSICGRRVRRYSALARHLSRCSKFEARDRHSVFVTRWAEGRCLVCDLPDGSVVAMITVVTEILLELG
jgi:hypothetical protein